MDMRNDAPREIWLQWDPDGDAEMYDYPSEGVTWCSEQVHDTDVRYVRADVAEADAVRADTDSLREKEGDWPEPVADGNAPTFEHGIEVGRKRLIGEIQNGEWPPELYDVPPQSPAPERWEPVDEPLHGYALCRRVEAKNA